jgi:hypothetical protein
LLVASIALVWALSACGGSSSGGNDAATAAASPAAVSETTTAAADSGSGSNSGSPTPTGDDKDHLVYVLESVNPGVGKDDDALVKKSMSVCTAILGGKSAADVQAQTGKEFTNGSYTPSPEEIKAIDATIVAYFCR